jgi:hypothetical protein
MRHCLKELDRMRHCLNISYCLTNLRQCNSPSLRTNSANFECRLACIISTAEARSFFNSYYMRHRNLLRRVPVYCFWKLPSRFLTCSHASPTFLNFTNEFWRAYPRPNPRTNVVTVGYADLPDLPGPNKNAHKCNHGSSSSNRIYFIYNEK